MAIINGAYGYNNTYTVSGRTTDKAEEKEKPATEGAANTQPEATDKPTVKPETTKPAAETEKETAKPTGPSAESRKLTERFNKLVEVISKRRGKSLSFRDLRKESDKLEDEFDRQVKAELKALGVDTAKTFQLRYDERTGKMICSNHPDKEKIESYFNQRKDRVNQFRDIVDLRKITGMAQKKMTPELFRQRMNLLSMSVWMNAMQGGFSGSMGSMGMSMGSMGPSFYQGLNLKV